MASAAGANKQDRMPARTGDLQRPLRGLLPLHVGEVGALSHHAPQLLSDTHRCVLPRIKWS